MAHDTFEEDIELANGHPISKSRNEPNMAERTLLKYANENERLREYLKWAMTYVEAEDEASGLCPNEQSIYCQARALVNGF